MLLFHILPKKKYGGVVYDSIYEMKRMENDHNIKDLY
jgi:hypothetical protein